MSFTNPLPTETGITSGNPSATAFNALKAKYTDAAAWARWAGSMVEEQQLSISNTLGTNAVNSSITALTTLLNSIPAYSTSAISFTNSSYTSSLLTALEASLLTSVNTPSTGLGSAVETAMFDRATARTTAERLLKYNEITSSISSRGFDVPPGAVVAKQTELASIESTILADINKDILHETATLALTNNLEIRKITIQLIQVIGGLFDSKVMRDFEFAKSTLLTTIEGYKAQLAMYEVKGSVLTNQAKVDIDAALRHTTLEVESFRGIAQAAAQMVSSALNGVNVSSSYGFSGNEGVSYQLNGDIGTATVPTGTPT
jgi:hypothetical protein